MLQEVRSYEGTTKTREITWQRSFELGIDQDHFLRGSSLIHEGQYQFAEVHIHTR